MSSFRSISPPLPNVTSFSTATLLCAGSGICAAAALNAGTAEPATAAPMKPRLLISPMLCPLVRRSYFIRVAEPSRIAGRKTGYEVIYRETPVIKSRHETTASARNRPFIRCWPGRFYDLDACGPEELREDPARQA